MFGSAISYALLSLFFAGVNDVIFKRYSREERSRGMLIFGIGLVWCLLQMIDIHISQSTLSFSRTTVIYGSIAGACVALANICLLEGLRNIDVSLGATIYRLNTIGVVILSVFFLGEMLSLIKLAGIALGVVAVLMLYQRRQNKDRKSWLNLGVATIVFASLLRAVYGVVSKAGLSAGANADSMILISAACWVLSGLLYAILVERRYSITAKKIAYAGVSGFFVYGIVKCLITALELGEASVVVPIANMSFLVALLIAVVFKLEPLTLKKLFATILAAGAITLLTRV